MYYLHFYNTQVEHDSAYTRGPGGSYEEPWVAYTKETDSVSYNLPPIDWSQEYLTFKAIDFCTFKFSGNSIDYSVDGGVTWVSLASNSGTPRIQSGDTIMFKKLWEPPESTASVGRFSSTGRYEVMGNANSLLFGDDFKTATDLTGKASALKVLFSGSTNLISAERLVLPATTLTDYCYQSMFLGCTALTTAPELPATTMTNGCYASMFYNCSSLVSAPELPATTLSSSCYYQMFHNCSSLVSAPELPAIALADYCYGSMFYNCSSLVSAPELRASILTSGCYSFMFYACRGINHIEMLATDISASTCLNRWVQGVSSSGTFTKNASMTTLPTGANGIPTGWTVVDAT